MPVIDRAIKKGWHTTLSFTKADATWDDFEKALLGKKLVLYGVGDGAEYYYFKYKEKAFADFAVDASPSKKGMRLYDALVAPMSEEQREILIHEPAFLQNADKEELVILICSLKSYEAIARRLESQGYENVFALLPMEAKCRIEGCGNASADIEEYRYSELRELGIDNKKIVILSMFDFGGHGKEIVRQILRIRNDLDIVWLVNDLNITVEQGVRLVLNQNKRQCFMEMESAKIWICDTGIPELYVKREGQIYIQIKHWASITLKNFGFDLARSRRDEAMLDFCVRDSKMIDYIMVGSRFDEKTCRTGFEFKGECIHVGSPRSDILFDSEDICSKIKRNYGIDNEAKVLLYAPTFRCEKADDYRPNQVKLDVNYEEVKYVLEHALGGEWYIFLRLHPVVAHKADEMELPPYVINVSNYHDSQELVAACDAMITDYSSIMFEPAFVKKPVFLLATDRKEYIDGERGLLIDYDELPFPISESNVELKTRISEFDKEDYERGLGAFFEKYGVREDGRASERAAQFISDIIDRKI